MLFAFVSRHKPTPEQFALAEDQGITIEHVGDMDAFSITPADIHALGPYEGVIVVHAAAALRLCPTFLVGVYGNENRAPEGERPQFYANRLDIYDRLD